MVCLAKVYHCYWRAGRENAFYVVTALTVSSVELKSRIGQWHKDY